MKESQWFVLYTKPRNEKKVADRLSKRGFEIYCPMKKVKRQWSDRIKLIEEPLFSSYIFIKIHDSARDLVFSEPGVVRYLFWLGKAAVVREEEMVHLKSFMNDYEYNHMEVNALTKNDLVRLKSGPLTGRKGIIEKMNNRKAILYLEDLQFKVTVSLNQTNLQKVG